MKRREGEGEGTMTPGRQSSRRKKGHHPKATQNQVKGIEALTWEGDEKLERTVVIGER